MQNINFSELLTQSNREKYYKILHSASQTFSMNDEESAYCNLFNLALQWEKAGGLECNWHFITDKPGKTVRQFLSLRYVFMFCLNLSCHKDAVLDEKLHFNAKALAEYFPDTVQIGEGNRPYYLVRKELYQIWLNWQDSHRIKKNKRTMIYFIYDEELNMVKIGETYNVDKRFRAIANARYPYEIKLLHHFTSGYETERNLHKKFAKQRLSLEWFRYDTEIENYIKQLKQTA